MKICRNVHDFVSSSHFFSPTLTFFEKILSDLPLMSYNFNLDQARQFVKSDPGTNCLQRISADARSLLT